MEIIFTCLINNDRRVKIINENFIVFLKNDLHPPTDTHTQREGELTNNRPTASGARIQSVPYLIQYYNIIDKDYQTII